jgi:catechol 2,3-dioxygenase-like lactoylglutathione lyase family enzyme
MFEFFAPKERGERGQGRLLDKFGDHYIGIEFQVPNLDEARAAAAENDVRIINDLGSAFFTYPGTSFGVAWEIYDGNFQQYHKDPSFWRDEHPMGLLGVDHVTIAVNDLDASLARLTQLTDSTVLDKVTRPQAGAEGVRAQAGNIQFEVLQPTGDGPVASYIAQYGERIRSTVWKVADLGKVRTYLTGQGFDLVPGDAEGALAIPPAQNKNLLFEFTE